jgi:hypothetical protein
MKDEELGDLLRETFTSKEHQVDTLPEAINPAKRRTGPILLAVASVLVVLGGIVYAVSGGAGTGSTQAGRGGAATVPRATDGPGSTMPGSTPTGSTPTESSVTDAPEASENAQIWSAVIAEILAIEKPAAGWPGARVLDAPNAGAGGGSVTYELAKRFTANERAAMERSLKGIARLEWVRNRPQGGKELCEQPPAKEPYVTVGPIVSVQGHIEVGAWVWRGCLDAHWLTYRLDQQAGGWKITGTVGAQGVS